jgi:hypothetical protein
VTTRTLYVSRPLLNADDLVTWAKEEAGFGKTLTADDMHVTVAFSRAAVDWDALVEDTALLTVIGGARFVKPLGDKGAIVLRFFSQALADRWQTFRDAGASWDWPGYYPHVTITYDGSDADLENVTPYDGALVFGPEVFAEVDEDWTDKVTEKSTFAAPASPTSGLQGYDLEGEGARRRKAYGLEGEGARRRKRKRRKVNKAAGEPAFEGTSTMDLKLFIPITKVDAARRLVYGVATAEQPDVSNEICDYASTKPLYQKWSQRFADTTDGKSLGNLRAMHGNVAAGKVVELAFNDDEKQIEICGKVVDDAEWAKVEEGVYTGFSQGGHYVKRWKDGGNADLTRYTAEPVEISLVDSPCLPGATFSMIKADGTSELRKFKPAETLPLSPAMSRAEMIKYAAAWQPGDKVSDAFWQGFLLMRNATGSDPVTGGDALIAICKAGTAETPVAEQMTKIAALAKRGDDPWRQVTFWESDRLPGQRFTQKHELAAAITKFDEEEAAKKAAAPVLDALADIEKSLAAREGADAGAGKTTEHKPAGDGGAVIKKDYSDDERKDMASKGEAMKDGSYPIKNKGDLKDAIEAFGRAKNKAATKRHIVKRAKALGATDMLPADWPGSTKDKDTKKLAGDGALAKAASLWSVARLIEMLQCIYDAEEMAEMPSWGLGASVELPKDLTDRFGSALVELGDIAAVMLDAVLGAIKEEEKEEEAAKALALATAIADLVKLAGDGALAKAGARHSKADKARIAHAHDLLTELDPDCCPAGDDDDENGDAEKLAKQLAAVRSANDKLLNDTILPAIKSLAGRLDAIDANVKTIADQPLPMGTSSVNTRLVEKRDDDGLEERAEALRFAVLSGRR